MISFEEFKKIVAAGICGIEEAFSTLDWDTVTKDNVNDKLGLFGTLAHIVARLGTADNMQKLLTLGVDLTLRDHDRLSPFEALDAYKNPNEAEIAAVLPEGSDDRSGDDAVDSLPADSERQKVNILDLTPEYIRDLDKEAACKLLEESGAGLTELTPEIVGALMEVCFEH